jgi:predicted HAD superfamily Cof-like phosphohydrolase
VTTKTTQEKRLAAKEKIYQYVRTRNKKYKENSENPAILRLKYLCERVASTLNLMPETWLEQPLTVSAGVYMTWERAIELETLSKINQSLATHKPVDSTSLSLSVRDIMTIAMKCMSPLLPTCNYGNVAVFMRAASQQTPAVATVPDLATAKLRSKLQVEETLELVRGLGTAIMVVGKSDSQLLVDTKENTISLPLTDDAVKPVASPEFCWSETVDGLNDIGVIADGTAVALGLSSYLLQLCRVLVDISNLDKFDEGSYMRDDGKWVKQPDWVAPPIASVLTMFGVEDNRDRVEQAT